MSVRFLATALSCALLLAGCATSRVQQDVRTHDASRVVVVTIRNSPGAATARAGSTPRDYVPPANYSVSPAARANARALAASHGLREISAWPIGLLGVHCLMFELPAQVDRETALNRLRSDPRVESAQPLHSFNVLTSPSTATQAPPSSTSATGRGQTTSSLAGSNDPYRGLQRNLDAMDVTHAHARSRGEGVHIAIIDTGIDGSHPDLAGRIVTLKDFIEEGRPASGEQRHGTAVAGIIAAVENNHVGIVGVAPGSRLHGYRACWPETANGAGAVCNTFTLAKALAAAIESRVDIVNLSLTGPADPLLTRLVDIGLRRDMVFVGAVAPNSSGAVFPTSIDGVIKVDAVGAAASPDATLFAPGTEVLTLVPEGSYDFLSGSSLAAASVSGGIALLRARSKHLPAAKAQQILAETTRTISTPGGVASTINLCSAVNVVLKQPPCAE